MLVHEVDLKRYRVVSHVFGFDVIVGRGKLFNLPRWWSFQEVEKGSLLAASLMRLQQMGSVSYFMQLFYANCLKYTRYFAEDELL